MNIAKTRFFDNDLPPHCSDKTSVVGEQCQQSVLWQCRATVQTLPWVKQAEVMTKLLLTTQKKKCCHRLRQALKSMLPVLAQQPGERARNSKGVLS